MRLFPIMMLGLLSTVAQGQQTACHQPELAAKQLSGWMAKAHTRTDVADVLCYLHRQAKLYAVLAEEQHAALLDAYDHPIGSSKYPSAADHARFFEAQYRGKVEEYDRLAKWLETRERHTGSHPCGDEELLTHPSPAGSSPAGEEA